MAGEPPRLHPDDMASLVEAVGALFKQSAETPPPYPPRPSVSATGLDAKMIRQIIDEAIQHNKREIAGPDERSLKSAVREAVRDEIARDHDRSRDECRRMIREEAHAICREAFADLDMPIDTPEHRLETNKKLSAIFDQHLRAKGLRADLWKEVVKAIATQIVLGTVGVLAYLGLRSGSGGR